ncbi:hypothetical protein GBZ26_11270 [Azospirillum formosense]|uniref:Uncharacterized protein n=1 Tax=Azospirillum formosense TaxID=861533 RepID=A0ABX2KT83_9PROT|nr:hypothetical protein [Azospirillum formosense]MBY3756711.1 hypothetical protein [Azospirillum formosense]NUB19791.1 hypothetical protein [Azospirillum formosense]
MLASRVRQSIQGAGPTSFMLTDDAATTQSRTIVTAYGSGPTRPGVFTIVDVTASQWAVVEGYATAGSTDSFTVTRTIRNSQGNANNLTWSTTNTKTIFVGECADLLALLCQCPTTGGTGAAYTVTYAPTPLALVSNAVIRLIPHITSVGAAPTLAVNGLPAWPIVRANGQALTGGDLSAGGVVELVCDVTNSRFRLLSSPATSRAAAWVHFDGNGSIFAAAGVASVTRTGVGSYTVNFAATMPNAVYPVAGATANNGVDGANAILLIGTRSTGSVSVSTVRRSDGVLTDAASTSIAIFGA